jgi:hypothetical protein
MTRLASNSAYYEALISWQGNTGTTELSMPGLLRISAYEEEFFIRELAMPRLNLYNIMVNVDLINMIILAEFFQFDKFYEILESYYMKDSFEESPYFLEALKYVYKADHPRLLWFCEIMHAKVPTMSLVTIQEEMDTSILMEGILEYYKELKHEADMRRNSCCYCDNYCKQYNLAEAMSGKGMVPATQCCASPIHFRCAQAYLYVGICPRCGTRYVDNKMNIEGEALHVTIDRALLREEQGLSDDNIIPSLERVLRVAIPSGLRQRGIYNQRKCVV